MIRDNLSWLLVAGIVAVAPLSQGTAHPLDTSSATEAGVIAIQGWPGWQGGPHWTPDQERREHCWHLQNRAREIQDRMYYAPPWERERMERHLWEIRQQARGECRGGGRREWD